MVKSQSCPCVGFCKIGNAEIIGTFYEIFEVIKDDSCYYVCDKESVETGQYRAHGQILATFFNEEDMLTFIHGN